MKYYLQFRYSYYTGLYKLNPFFIRNHRFAVVHSKKIVDFFDRYIKKYLPQIYDKDDVLLLVELINNRVTLNMYVSLDFYTPSVQSFEKKLIKDFYDMIYTKNTVSYMCESFINRIHYGLTDMSIPFDEYKYMAAVSDSRVPILV